MSNMATEPGLHHENVKEASGLYCFLNSQRPCTAECAAYFTDLELPQGPDYKDKQWAHCLVLVNVHRAGKHLVVLADAVTRVTKQQADSARDAQVPPHPPR